jgi:hypothetical protein
MTFRFPIAKLDLCFHNTINTSKYLTICPEVGLFDGVQKVGCAAQSSDKNPGEQQTQDKLRDEIIQLTKLITQQNYFQFQNRFYRQDNGLAMGAPTSSLLSEIVLQHIENTALYKILTQNHVIEYFRYLDDILII